MIEIGCSTICFRKLSVDLALARIGSLGFRTADIGMVAGFCPHYDPYASTEAEDEKLAEMVRDTSLSISTLNVGRGALNDPSQKEEQKVFVQRCLDLARALGCYAVTMQPGRPPMGKWDKDARSVAVDLSELGEYADGLGLMLTIEAPHRGTLVTRVEEAKALLDMTESENVYVALDTSHVMRGGMQPSKAVELLADRVGHVHLRDALGDDILVTPGEGEVDYLSFHRSLVDAGYDHAAILELEYEDKNEDETAIETVKARDYLAGLWRR